MGVIYFCESDSEGGLYGWGRMEGTVKIGLGLIIADSKERILLFGFMCRELISRLNIYVLKEIIDN